MRHTVQLRVTFKYLTVTPAPLDVLESLLILNDWSFRRGLDGRLQRHSKKIRLFRRRGVALRTWPGLLRRVHAALAAAGYVVSVQDKRRSAIAHDRAWPATLGGEDREILNAFAGAHRGYVSVRAGEIRRLIALTCRLFPDARILVPCDSRRKVDDFHRALSDLLDEPVSKIIGKNWQPGVRIAVCNMQSFDTPCFGDWDLVLFPGLREVLHRATRNNVLNENGRRKIRKMTRAAHAVDLDEERRHTLQRRAQIFGRYRHSLPPMATYRIFGFLPETFALQAREQLRLEQICGHQLYPRQGPADSSAAQVIMLQVASAPPTGRRNIPNMLKQLKAWHHKQEFIWHNEARNESIASIAAAFAAGEMAALWKHGLLLLDAPQDWFQQQGRSLRVNVLVEVPKHARQLLQRLPGWQLAADLPLNATIRDTAPKSFEMPYYLDKHVVTAAYVERHGLDADVVIRADGLADRWNIQCGRSAGSSRVPMLVVDVFDDGDERAVAAARLRVADYRRRGWPVNEPQRLATA